MIIVKYEKQPDFIAIISGCFSDICIFCNYKMFFA